MGTPRITLLACAFALAACDAAPPAPPRIAPTQPLARQTPPPAYPEVLACDGIGGQVVLALDITAAGTPANVSVRRGSGQPALDAAAVDAVKGWTFAPATALGQPVASKLQVPVTFTPPQLRPDACFVLDEQRRRAAQR